ncbi:NACHT, LRR and PYD domains-containing protein 3-like [Anneissia japonica]|uniref:NACHT, LRR and PYD domains-containing protein 3-like n=1 Tax=Anneissia japonica TaxID=1529436 RepID=UPI00142574B1|nr:NACHT, LRR and PYD domains-containing protein 3-like [Anneissia japonica]
MFTDLDLLKENEKKQDVKPTTLNEVLNIIKSTPACKVLIEGEGGIGKSTLLRYIAYNWATESDKTFKGKIVFLVKISTIDKSETFLDGILKQIDIEDFYLETNLSQDPVLVKRFIRNHDNDIVLLLDGLDELKEGSKSPICLFKKEKMLKCKVILTTRSENIDEFVKESSIHVKVKGFSEVNVRNYIKKHFEYFKEPALGDSLLDELELISGFKYKHVDVKEMCKNPMLLLSVCIMWEERQHLPADKADLFKEIFRTILNQFIEKQADKEQKISVFKNIPQKYVEPMLLLGKCMYNGLKRNQLSINKAEMEGREEMVALALKLGFVYKDTPNLKSDFEEIFTAPHKLIVESLVGFYLCKLCQAAGLESECSVGMKRLLQQLDDNEWKIIRENTHLQNARVFAIGFLGTGAGMFFNHWITNNPSTYRSLRLHFKFVKIEHRCTVVKELFDEMTKKNLEIMPHINDICESLRKVIHHFISDVKVNQIENFLQIMQIFSTSSKFSGQIGRDNFESWLETYSGKEMSSEEKCKMIAHIMIAVSDQSDILHIASKICGDDIKCLTEECQKLNFKYDITQFELHSLSTASFIIHLFSFAPQLYSLNCSPCCITGAIMNDVMKECCSRRIKLELKELYIRDNNLGDIDGSLLASLLVISPTLSTLDMSGCSLSGVIVNDMIRECCSAGVKLELKKLDISGNNLGDIDGSLLASLLVISPTLSTLYMSGCSLSGVTVNDMMREYCSAGVKLKLKKLDISGNNLGDIDGSLLASLLVIYPTLSTLDMSGCSLSGVTVNDMIRECCSAGVKLELKELDISGNNLSDIDGSLLASLLVIASPQFILNMSGCSLSGVIVNDMMRECCRAGVKLELLKLDITGNNLSDIDGSLIVSFYELLLNFSIYQ